MFIDLDGFKRINDTLGHNAGDFVLKQVAQRLLSCIRETDTVARVGGDELGPRHGNPPPDNAALIAEKIIRFVSQPMTFEKEPIQVGASIGIALYPDHGEDCDQLIKSADEAMYKIKSPARTVMFLQNPAFMTMRDSGIRLFLDFMPIPIQSRSGCSPRRSGLALTECRPMAPVLFRIRVRGTFPRVMSPPPPGTIVLDRSTLSIAGDG